MSITLTLVDLLFSFQRPTSRFDCFAAEVVFLLHELSTVNERFRRFLSRVDRRSSARRRRALFLATLPCPSTEEFFSRSFSIRAVRATTCPTGSERV